MKWISVDDKLPDEDFCYVLVACEGGKIDVTFYSEDRELLKNYGNSYSRKCQGKLSGYFSLSHAYGYEITHWMPLPEPPAE